LVGRDASELAAKGKKLDSKFARKGVPKAADIIRAVTQYQAYSFDHDEYENSSMALKKHLAVGRA
jgi:hypothetical protein